MNSRFIICCVLAIAISLVHHVADAVSVTPDCDSTPALREDCTPLLQSILSNKSVSELVLIPGKTYITLPLVLTGRKSGFTISCPPAGASQQQQQRAVLLAKRWAFNSTGATLLSISDSNDISINGACTLRMWRHDYANPKLYKHAEWRMALTLSSVQNAVINGANLEHSGGDGLYLTCGRSRPSKNITLMNVLSKDNYRQGMSVICVDGLTVLNTIFEGTKGTPPQAGVDFEPNDFWQHQSNMLFRNVLFKNNTGNGISIALYAMNNSSPSFGTWTFQNVTVDGSQAGQVSKDAGGVYVEFNAALHPTPSRGPLETISFDKLTVKNRPAMMASACPSILSGQQ